MVGDGGGSACSEVQAGGVRLHPLGSHRVYVPLPQQYVLLAVQFDLGTVLRVEQDPVPHYDRAYVGADADHRSPGQAPAHGSGGRDDDPGTGTALALGPVQADQDTVM